MKFRATAIPIATPTPVLPMATETAIAPTTALMLEVLSASTSTLPAGGTAASISLFSIDAIVWVRITFVDSEAPPATPTLVPPPEIAIATAAATVATSIVAPSWALTRMPPCETTLGRLTRLAKTDFSMRLCASARPMDTDTAVALVLPAMLAEAATAIALIDESSQAATTIDLTIGAPWHTLIALDPPAETVAVPFGAVLAIVASTRLSISLKLNAPVAPTPIAVALPLIATATAMPKASESILASLSADTMTLPSDSMSESSTAARVVFWMLLTVTEIPRATPTAVFWLTAIESAIAPAVELIHELSSAVTLTPAPLPAAVVRLLPLWTSACVLLRMVLMPMEPATPTATPEPPLEPAALPAAPMPSAKIPASISA